MPTEMRLLVGYDGFERRCTLPRDVTAVARRFSADVTLFHAVPPLAKPTHRTLAASRQELQNALMEARLRELQHLARQVRGVRATAEITIGSPEKEIIRAALHQRAGLVTVLANPRKFGEKGGGFGATTIQLMRQCPTAVWAVRPRRRVRPPRVMAAVDVNADDAALVALSGQILEVAAAFANQPGARLWIVHAWSFLGEGLLSGFGRVPRRELARLAREEEQSHRADLNRLLARHDLRGIDSCIELVRGCPNRTIPEEVDRLGVDILVIGTTSRTGILPRLVRGNTAERILNSVNASIVAVKPPAAQ
ncbi:MAG TPA: universal stress protein [Polyangiaceae bacterium]